MINLLPKKEKELAEKEQRNKIIIILWFLFFLFLLTLFLALLSIEFCIKGQADYRKIILSGKEVVLEQSGIKEFQENAKESNRIVKEISAFYKKKNYFTKTIEEFSDTLPTGIYLNTFSVNVSEKGFSFNVSGFSPTRESLFEFKKELEKSNFDKVFFPQDNWIKGENINFYLSFELLEKQ